MKATEIDSLTYMVPLTVPELNTAVCENKSPGKDVTFKAGHHVGGRAQVIPMKAAQWRFKAKKA